MPFPLVVAVTAIATGVVNAVVFVKDVAIPLADATVGPAIGRAAAEYVLKERIGISLDLDGEISKKTITEAICRDILGGELQFSNLFDRAAVKADVKRIAIEQASQSLGFAGGGSIESIRDQLTNQLLDEIRAEIEAENGAFIEAAKGLASTQALLEKPKKEDWNKPVDFSEKGISNRARQAKYRAAHTRHWEVRA